MQSLRSTSLRRLCLSATALVTRPPPNPLLPTLLRRSQSFTSSSTRWYSSTNQFPHHIIEGTKEEKPNEPEAVKSEPTRVRSATNTLFLGNIPYSTTYDELWEIFSVYGSLSRVAIAKDDGGRSMGFAHIDFESKEDAVRANKDHEGSPVTIGGREIRIEYAFPQRQRGGLALPRRVVKDHHEPSPTIFVGNVPPVVTREDIREALGSLGDIAAVRIPPDKEGRPRGFAHVDFVNTAEAEKVLEHYRHNVIRVSGWEVRLDRSSPAETAYSPSPRLYFTKWEGDASSLRSHFRALRSKIVDIYFAKSPDPSILTRSGFVEFRDMETASEALARFNTPELALAYARSRDRSKPRLATRGQNRPVGFGLLPKKRRERSGLDE